MGASVPDLIRLILSDNPKRSIDDPSLTPAGVTLLLYPKDDDYCVLLNKRTDLVEHHKGEISFPGGRMDDEDDSLLDTALRETHEEMGIKPEDVEILGEIDDVPTVTNYLINTYVGTIPYPYEFNPSNIEVAEVLEMPLSDLMSSSSIRDEVRVINGKLRYSPVYAYQGHIIFGATARILSKFVYLLDNAPDKERLWSTNRLPQ